MFAVIDLETTGGNPNAERIIEIGIVLHDGKQKIGEYTTLINPEKEISAFISTFTGITNSMVQHAPKFIDVADTILELLEGKIIVAHNARFDYNFIKSEYRRINIPFTKKNICTVQLSRKIFPEIKSHSLGNLCRDLGITVDNRHRAFGDAAATAILLEKLIQHDTKNLIKEYLDDDINRIYLPQKLNPKTIEILPEEVGVFYFHNERGEVIYLEKAKNIRDYIFTLFAKKPVDKYKQQFYTEITDISFELTGNELIASLRETIEIKKTSPKYNRPIANAFYKYGLFSEIDAQGFQRLLIKILNEEENAILKFSSKFKAEKMMHTILSNFRLEPTFKKIDDAIQYNKRMQDVLMKFIYPHDNFYIIDTGRGGTERTAILIEKGEYKGFGFFEPAFIAQPEELRNTILFSNEKVEMKKIIQNYIRKNTKYIELIPC